MFIEKVSDENISKFIAKVGISTEQISKNNNSVYVIGKNKYHSPMVEFYFEDFSAQMLNNYQDRNDELECLWRKFLYQKFGEQYKVELVKHLDKKKKEILAGLE